MGVIINAVQLLVDLTKLLVDLKIIEPLGLQEKFKIKQKSQLILNLEPYKSMPKNALNNRQLKLIKRRLKALFYTLKKDKYGCKIILGSKFISALGSYLSYNNSIKLIKYWRDCNFISFSETALESQSIVKILREDDLLESVSSCKSRFC